MAEQGSSKSRPSTASAQQAAQLEKLLKDPSKPVHIPQGPSGESKGLRPPVDMMKNVMGSSAGAGSGEFHIYKHSRRREFERLRQMDEDDAREKAQAAAQAKQSAAEAQVEAKTAKNRAKRQKRKDRGKAHGVKKEQTEGRGAVAGKDEGSDGEEELPAPELKKRKMVASSAVAHDQAPDQDLKPEAEDQQGSEAPAPSVAPVNSLSIVDAD